MAITVTLDYPRTRKIAKNLRMISGSIAFDANYVTGGELANGANGITRHFKSCKEVICEAKSGYMFEWDATNKKIKVLAPNNVVEGNATADANNTLVVANSVVEVAGDGSAVQALGGEMANDANLAALTGVKFVAYGY